MGNPAPRTPSAADALDHAALSVTLNDEAADSAFAEWGYEAADPTLLARQWGESSFSFEDR